MEASTTSQDAWEADALSVLRDLLPDAAPFDAWTNFQFNAGGRIHEVDALVTTPKSILAIASSTPQAPGRSARSWASVTSTRYQGRR